MNGITQEYFDVQFAELLRTVKEGLDACATKADLKNVQRELKEVKEELISDIRSLAVRMDTIESHLRLLTEEVREFVAVVKKQEMEYAVA